MPALYETHIPVSDLNRSSVFYRNVVGLTPGFAQPERGVEFLYVGTRESGMIGLWAPGSIYGWSKGEKQPRHLAISVTLEGLFASIPRLRDLGIEVAGFDGKAATEPSVIGWMPSAQIYFRDPDGHLLEFIHILPDQPVVSFFGRRSEWQKQKGS